VNWEALGAVAELIGAVGVIASLFYLAHQIRRNSSALEAATNQAISDAAQGRLVAVAQSPDLAEAFAKAVFSRDELSKRERVQVEFFTRATFRGLENAHVQYRQGLISQESWRAQEELLRNFLRLPHVKSGGPETGASTSKLSPSTLMASFPRSLLPNTYKASPRQEVKRSPPADFSGSFSLRRDRRPHREILS